jgi:hypothetical protein
MGTQPPPPSGDTHWPLTQVAGAVHGPQSIELPQPSPASPHARFCWTHVAGRQLASGETQVPEMQALPAAHAPQSMTPPQPLPAWPQ